MRTRASRLVLPIDPNRPTGWALIELMFCAGRDACRLWCAVWRGRAIGIGLRVVIAVALWVVGTAADQRLHVFQAILTALLG